MNVLKHMEAIFVAAALVAVPAASMAKAPDTGRAEFGAGFAANAAVASGARMAVVTVSAKRLSAAEKTDLLAADTVTIASRL